MGLATTPACFMSTIEKGYMYDGALMCTASHLPWNRNGIKFFTKSGGLKKPDISAILGFAAEHCAEMDYADFKWDGKPLGCESTWAAPRDVSVPKGEPCATGAGFQNKRHDSLSWHIPTTLLQLLGLRHRRHTAPSAYTLRARVFDRVCGPRRR